jgi:MFS family permease
MAIAAFSTIVEWYDFTLYLYLSTVLSRVFFGGGATSLAVTLGGFAIAYLMRPLGALFFGQFGDRRGPSRDDAALGGADDGRDAGDGAAADPRAGRARRPDGCWSGCVASWASR